MEKEQVTGKIDELKGKAKRGLGKATHNSNLQNKGLADELKGKTKQVYGEIKEAIKDADKEAGTDLSGR